MGLDLYVGPLTRYYTGNWETILQQAAKGSDISVKIVRPNPPNQGWFARLLDQFRPRGPAAAARAVRRWRNRLRTELRMPDRTGTNIRKPSTPRTTCMGLLRSACSVGCLRRTS